MQNSKEKRLMNGAMLPPEFIEALGLPEHTIGFTLRAEDPSAPIIIEAEYLPHLDEGDIETIITEFRKYEPVKIEK